MKHVVLLLASVCCLQASIVPILSGIATSGLGVSGTGSYQSDVFVQYALEQYDREDVGLANLQQSVYFRYSYVFAAGLDDSAEGFRNLIIELPESCASDPECIFQIDAEGATFTPRAITLHTQNDGITSLEAGPALHGIKLENLSPTSHVLALSFLSNRIPSADGRIFVEGGEDFLITEQGVVITPNLRVLPQTDGEPVATPEPLTIALCGAGIASMYRLRRLSILQ